MNKNVFELFSIGIYACDFYECVCMYVYMSVCVYVYMLILI